MEQKDLFIVPDFIKEIVNKKFYALCFASHIKKIGDTSNGSDFLENILFEKEIKIVNNWAISN